ncbi:YdeI/OmpD-associated family protein [Carboxylicivirga sp. RSCT41]|uniref:YdeI/OmpD-associated family protein n=1 Tax=Carboxylicivirga agarovorans TaxID=3417570 RepID=UPI003D32C0F7
MSSKKSLVDKNYLLQKFEGKGGWTYAEIPEIKPDKHAWFNWIKVHGFIDQCEIRHARLMPVGNGRMMLPVKAAIRKAIGKQAGDTVRIILYPDNLPSHIPQEIIDCLELEDSRLMEAFNKETANQQQEIVTWIYEAKKEETKARRIIKMMDYLKEKHLK